jgi:hypothetical protein
MDRGILRSLYRPLPPPLRPPSIDRLALEEQLEGTVRSLLESHRRQPPLSIPTQWDEALSYVGRGGGENVD